MKRKNILLLSTFCIFFQFSTAQNLIQNGSFESNFTGWNNLSENGGVAAYSILTTDKVEGNKSMSVVVTTKGTNQWSIQSIGPGWLAQLGKTYTITFWAKASVQGLPLTVLEQNTKYYGQTINLTTDWVKYSVPYTALETTPIHKFWYTSVGTYYIDAVSIEDPTQQEQSIVNKFIISPQTTFQTIEGIGGSLAYYTNWVQQHPEKEKLYAYVFDSLGLDLLRLKVDSNYRNANFNPISEKEFVQNFKKSNADGKILMSSWAPSFELVNHMSGPDTATLVRENGVFVYGKFGQYWRDALVAYGNAGVSPDFISIQNEPDWLTKDWETTQFAPTETASLAGYDKALDSVYAKISSLTKVPKLLGAEPLGLENNNFARFNDPIKPKAHLYGYAYHLYNGGSPSNPDTYVPALTNIANSYNDRPNFMTEFELKKEHWFKTAWLVNNVFKNANATAYFHWDLIWPETGLIGIDNPWDKTTWKNSLGFTISPHFQALRHFSKHLNVDFKRIKDTSDNEVVRSSAFLNKEGNQIVAVQINTGAKSVTSTLQLEGYNVLSSNVIQSVEGSLYKTLGSLPATGNVVLPDSSVTTIILDVEPLRLTLDKAIQPGNINTFPNPFDNFSNLIHEGTFQYSITDVTGVVHEKGNGINQKVIGMLLMPGVYTVEVYNEKNKIVGKIIKK